jgi:hypothetical protein
MAAAQAICSCIVVAITPLKGEWLDRGATAEQKHEFATRLPEVRPRTKELNYIVLAAMAAGA